MLVGATEVELVQVCWLEHQRGEEVEFNRLLVQAYATEGKPGGSEVQYSMFFVCI